MNVVIYINPDCAKLFYFEVTCKYQDNILKNISYILPTLK